MKPIIRTPHQGRTVALVGDVYRFVATGEDTNCKPAKMLDSVSPAGLEKMFMEIGVPLAEGAATALPPTREEIEKLLAVAPQYGIEIRLPH